MITAKLTGAVSRAAGQMVDEVRTQLVRVVVQREYIFSIVVNLTHFPFEVR